jgi:hypothetical protein
MIEGDNMRKHVTQKEALKQFRKDILPDVRKKYGRKDKPAAGLAWVEYIDYLERSSLISPKQAREWRNPFYR